MLGDEAFRLVKEAKDITTEHIPTYNEEQVRLVTQETRYLWTRIEEMIASLNTSNNNSQQGTSTAYNQTSSAAASGGSNLATSQTYMRSNLQTQDMDGNLMNGSGMGGRVTDGNEFVENTNAQAALYLLTLNRNKRCLLAYHRRRVEFVRSLLWALHLAPSLAPSALSLRLAPEELNYAREYARLNSAYRDAVEGQLCHNESLDWTANGELPPRDLLIEVRVVKDCGEIVTENGVVNLQAGSQHYLHRSDIEHLITIGYLEHISAV
ncbi:DNA replication protein psf1 [Kickxella alabastrina]|uniref:DNA replication protein psf1 n=1 Tax=Kickxella alabastrina TaxID=61397 RepID=A0ACC1ICY1_9FUNG|nr:DNA replication protein psf1 [Kickxella alabastrina]